MNEKLSRILLILGLVLTPLFFLPLTTDYFILNKQILFTGLTALALIAWLISNYRQKTIRLTLSPLLLPLLLLAMVQLVSLLLNTPKNPDAWLGRPALLATTLIWFTLITAVVQTSRQVKNLVLWLTVSGLTAAAFGLAANLGLLANLKLPAYLTVKSFNPTGSPLNLIFFILTLLPLSLIRAFRVTSGPKKLFYFLSSGVMLSCLILVGWQLLPNKAFTPLLLPKLAGWSIAADTLKTQAFFGAGPNNFLSRFTLFKPVSMNRTPLWSATFSASANEYLEILTTSGLLGLAAFIFLIFAWLKLVKRDPGTRETSLQFGLKLAVASSLILGLIFPFNAFSWIILSGYLALAVVLNKSKNLNKVRDVQPPFASSILPIITAVPAIALVSVCGWFMIKFYRGEIIFGQSIVAANQNRGADTYNLQIKALSFTPNSDRYHLAFSNTNLALANALSVSPATGTLSDQEKQTITQLVQQAVREARITTDLRPDKTANWQNLATIYRQLINFAQGADEFALAAYTQAVILDPANPALRLDWGGLLYSLNRFEEAAARFAESIELKPDYANAYYNLSHAYDQQKKYLSAYQAMQQVEALVPAGTTDSQTVIKELAELKTKLPKEAAATTTPGQEETQLSQPSPAPKAPSGFQPVDLETSPSPLQAATP